MRWTYLYSGGNKFLLTTYSLDQMQEVVLANIYDFCHTYGVRHTRQKNIILVESQHGYNRLIPAIAKDIGDVRKILGHSTAGAFVDEAIETPKVFLDEVIMRCSVPGAKIVMTNNPKGPKHWFKTEFIDRCSELDGGNGVHIPCYLADNPSLTPEYIQDLHNKFTGATLRRKVFGEWVADTGLVYPNIDAYIKPTPAGEAPYKYFIAVDVATSSTTHALLIALYPSGAWVVDEWVHNGAIDGQLTEIKQIGEINKALVGDKHITSWVVDPNASNFKQHLVEIQTSPVIDGINDVLEGIQITTHMFQSGRFNISPNCAELVMNMNNYEWDRRACELGEDKTSQEPRTTGQTRLAILR